MTLLQNTRLLLTASFVSTVILSSNLLQTLTPVNAAEVVQSNPSTLIAQSRSGIRMGTFVKAEAPTTGTAKIVKEGGQNYLEIDSAFSTNDQAPDLHVLLDPNANPPKSYSNMNGYVNLGKLHKVKGAQRYPIPSAIDLSKFKSVVIWCRMANATMGYATLK
ncbi:DM13 domain-containing protein [Aphanothece sacrum]|uniref:Electron transfer protein n=1 Tax=Aphanothece sacrum FPU1 TaxID=1920663 RepID=A0A401ICZ4_APHSA|nr:DM13 domain-containing protein [Aphanothece sacrum]GBF79111.1 electron transfer protein [Aphanothece sacrum FPU1]GBF85158.1 hypothetical protein AsFPU3_2215 [Aphanothece sacrum FPU3]